MADATTTIDELRGDVSKLHFDIAYRLHAMVNAARLLANHQRVYEAINDGARIDAEFDAALTLHCEAWRDPGACEDNNQVLPDLLRVACWELESLADRAEKLGEPGAEQGEAS